MNTSHVSLRPLLVAIALVMAAGSALAAGPGAMEGGRMNPEQMQKHHEQRASELKAKLKLSPSQEGAWSTFSAAMKPPANKDNLREQHAEMAKLTTPERIDRMQAMHAQRDAMMKQRGDATKAFYGQLTVEQKAIFDAQTGPGMHRRRGGAEHAGGPGHAPGSAQPNR
jgi:periplasmic protein CpxP/Spy